MTSTLKGTNPLTFAEFYSCGYLLIAVFRTSKWDIFDSLFHGSRGKDDRSVKNKIKNGQ